MAFGETVTFHPGDIIIDVNHDEADAAVYDGYGLMFRVVNAGLPVKWVIRIDKAYGQNDITALLVDPAPDKDGDLNDGTPLRKNYPGPFIIQDPNPSTVRNEAWDTITAIQAQFGYAAVDYDEIREALTLDRQSIHSIKYVPYVATGDDLADNELVLIQYPRFKMVECPGLPSDPTTVAGGGVKTSSRELAKSPAFSTCSSRGTTPGRRTRTGELPRTRKALPSNNLTSFICPAAWGSTSARPLRSSGTSTGSRKTARPSTRGALRPAISPSNRRFPITRFSRLSEISRSKAAPSEYGTMYLTTFALIPRIFFTIR
jgi:hypothetical protein